MKRAFTNIYELAKDRPLRSVDRHEVNDFYGHAHWLKRYAGRPLQTPSRLIVEHGAFAWDWTWDVDTKATEPVMLIFSDIRYQTILSQSDKIPFAIGPLIHYTPQALDDAQFQSEKKALGKNLLAFPPHSTHHIRVDLNIHDFCEALNEYQDQYDTIRICLYWKDVLNGSAELFEKAGFECVTAGHIYDPLFLPRLKSILSLSDVTTSSCFGGHLGCSIYLDRPHFFLKGITNAEVSDADVLSRDSIWGSAVFNAYMEQCLDLFSEPSATISQEQRDVVGRHWGFHNVRSPDQIALLFTFAERAEFLCGMKELSPIGRAVLTLILMATNTSFPTVITLANLLGSLPIGADYVTLIQAFKNYLKGQKKSALRQLIDLSHQSSQEIAILSSQIFNGIEKNSYAGIC